MDNKPEKDPNYLDWIISKMFISIKRHDPYWIKNNNIDYQQYKLETGL